MNKQADSVRSLGLTFIGTDIPTRAKLKAAAARAGMPLTKYLRLLADAVVTNTQGGLPNVDLPVKPDMQRIATLSQQAVELSRSIPMSQSRRMAVLSLANRHIMFNDERHAQMLYDKVLAEFETVRAKVSAMESGQLELTLEGDMA